MDEDIWVYSCTKCYWCSNINIIKKDNFCPNCKNEGSIIKFIGDSSKIGKLVQSALQNYVKE